MSNTSECIVNTIETANQAGNPALPAVALVRSAVHKEAPEAVVIPCEQCGVEFAISSELGDDKAQLRLYAEPFTPNEVCDTAKYTKVGDWATNLNKRWFKATLLESSDPGSAEGGVDSTFDVSLIGLEIILDDAAQNAAKARKTDSLGNSGAAAGEIDQSQDGATNTATILDTVLVRRDGLSWKEEIAARSTQPE